MNRKGEEKIISVYWFFILVIVAGGILLMVNAFYNDPYDVREIEASILSEKIADCISLSGKMNPDLISSTGIFKEEFKDNFLKRCSLNFDSGEKWTEIQYYAEINFYKYNYPTKNVFNISKGNQNWKADCDLDSKKYKKLVVCNEKEFYSVDDAGTIYVVKILSMVRKAEQNV